MREAPRRGRAPQPRVPLRSRAMTAPLLASAATDWIGAVSTLALGVIGLSVTLWQWWASGFRPKVEAFVDERHQGIEVRIVNRGRGNGVIDRVAVVEPSDAVLEDVAFNGFADGRFVPWPLPGSTAMTIVIEPSGDRPMPFACEDRVRVSWGADHEIVAPDVLEGASIYALESVLPPKGS